MISKSQGRFVILICCVILLVAGAAICQDQPPPRPAPQAPEMQGQPPGPPPGQGMRGQGFGRGRGQGMMGHGFGGNRGRFMAQGQGNPQGPQMQGPMPRNMQKQMRKRMMGPGMGMPSRRGAGPQEPGGFPMEALSRPEIQKQLGITADQRKKIEDIQFASQRSSIQANADVQIQQLELRHLMSAETADRAAVDKKIQDLAQAQASEMRARILSQLDARNVLTKEQRDKMRDVMQRQMRPAQNSAPQPKQPAGAPKAPAQPKPKPIQ